MLISSLVALGVALCSGTLSCIPSHRIVHDGNRYFEYCYGADFDPQLSATQKEACWQAWLAHYTRHQPPQRVDYAMRRVESFQSAAPVLCLPGTTAPAGPHELVVGAQFQTLAARGAATPPMPLVQAQVTDDGPVGIPNGCLDACNRFEGNCISVCPEGSLHCRLGCERERKICLGACH